MLVQFARWGNSLAIRIPTAFAREVAAEEGKTAEMTIADGKLVVSPVEGPVYKLDDLLAGITEDNLHGEIDTGNAIGAEFRWD